MPAPAPSRLLRSLEEITRAHPTARKRLVGPDVNHGRELLVALARRTRGWVGWEATTLRGIAEALAFLPLAEAGRRIAIDVEIGALVNRALEQSIAEGRTSDRFATLARSLGFRRALRDTLLELRTAGVSAAEVRAGAHPDSPAHDLPPVLECYERLLAADGLADPAAIFHAALAHFDREAPFVLDGVVTIAPSASAHGLPGELLTRLVAHGAVVLATDEPIAVPHPAHRVRAEKPEHAEQPSLLAWCATPAGPTSAAAFDASLATVDLFAAATPSDEIREVCRRVLAEGLRWDEVEIVATDPDVYGIALDALCQRSETLGATVSQGLPLARTRPGRALERWLLWLEDGLPADVLRQALEAGELEARDAELPPTALARELRSLRIGWGRARWEAALARLADGRRLAEITQREDEGDEEFAERRASSVRRIDALATLLRDLLAATPEVPERGSERPVRGSCARLAEATLRWLEMVPVHGQAEAQTVERLRGRLALLAEVEDAEVGFASALAALRDALADLRAWPLVTSDRKPWSAAGGMVHLTDVLHAGTTARPRVFVVGLDADRTAGAGLQDPLLPDRARQAIAPGRLATVAERREEAGYRLASALAGLRGRVTLSYATSGSLDGREAGPSPLLLQAWRLVRGDATLSYERLREHLRPPVAAVPARDGSGALAGAALLDARDVWLDALADGPLLLDGGDVVRAGFPMLDAGLRAQALAAGEEITAHHGLVPDAGPHLDPSARPDREISPSALEALASCPLAWFYRYGLSLRPPQDPEYDAERWLDALDRGSLLHEVFEAFAREYEGRQGEIADAAARDRVLAVAEEAIARWREKVPPPGEAVFEAEANEIRLAALAFLQMEREHLAGGDGARWSRFELGFGSGEAPGLFTPADGGTLAVRGRADRVDELGDGTLRVVDYKTGKPGRFAKAPKAGPFNGGRQLQPALYAAAVETITGKTVSRFEYRFPTARGGNETVAYSADELAAAREVVGSLLGHVRAGAFVPTNSCSDCTYCDYGTICRASHGDFATDSPRAAWAEARAEGLPIYAPMLARRGTAPTDGEVA